MDLLNLHQPWDCERFPKSKTICYGGGGGGGGTVNVLKGFEGLNPIKKVVKKVADQSGYTGSDLDKAGQSIEKGVTGGAKKVAKTAENVYRDSGKVDYAARFGNFTTPEITTPKVDIGSALTGVASGITASANTIGKAVSSGVSGASNVISSGVENIKKEGNKAVTQIKSEAGKLAKGDFSLKKAVQGTASGASETFKKSDVGKAVKTIADKSGYTGSDFDKSMQKVEKEGANVVNQTLDVVDQPGKYVAGKLEEFKQYAAERFGYAKKDDKKTARPKSRPATPGSDKTMGQGNIEGLKGGGSLAASERSRIRQNKRKLRIART